MPTLRLIGAAVGACFTLLMVGCSDQSPSAPSQPAASAPELALGGGQGRHRHLIVLKDGVNANLQAAISGAGGRIERSMGGIGVYTVSGLSDAAVKSLASRPEVEAVQADLRVQWLPPRAERMKGMVKLVGPAHHGPPLPGIDQSGAFFFDRFQWNMRVISADKAWLKTREGQGAKVCILDSGIDPTHLDLGGLVDPANTASFVEGEPATIDFDGHGTYVATLIASNGFGIASVAPLATLCAGKVLGPDGSGTFADLISGVIWAADNGADVINMSLGAYFSRKEEGAKALIRALQRAMNYAARRGVLLVASAGNDGVNLNKDPRDFISVPAELDHVLSIGATGPIGQADFDRIASYSNFGASGVDVFAPGGDFLPDQGGQIEDAIISACSTAIPGCEDGVTYFFAIGTSASAPHVSGEAAVIESDFPGDQSDEFLGFCTLISADHPTGRFRDPLYDHGRINVLAGGRCAPSDFGRRFVHR